MYDLYVYLQLLDRLGSVQLPPREGVPQHFLRAGGVDGGVVADGSSIINLNDTRSTDWKIDSLPYSELKFMRIILAQLVNTIQLPLMVFAIKMKFIISV